MSIRYYAEIGVRDKAHPLSLPAFKHGTEPVAGRSSVRVFLRGDESAMRYSGASTWGRVPTSRPCPSWSVVAPTGSD